jgi:Rps23 Pro-64 3,4-dihydroxylase Tpa1-like proline 4-hydroxylase
MIHECNYDNLIKIEKNYLEKINNEECLKYFGNWVNNIEELNKQFKNAEPFENVVIDNFLEESYAEKLYSLFPDSFENWYNYENPLEVKFAYDNVDILPDELKDYFYYLSSNVITSLFRKITNIEDLEYDEYLHGAGLHAHPRHGRLNIHLDYEKHPYSGKERRLNIILILTKNWKPEWNGCNELWDANVTECKKRTENVFNRAIIFKTNDISWHGLPEKIMCPENVYRKSLAYYYVSPLNSIKDENKYRSKAVFVKRPHDSHDENLETLYKIRPHRRITKEDMNTFMPNWKKED